eukprot:1149834-Pelagomonas_calceolata.AAC.1
MQSIACKMRVRRTVRSHIWSRGVALTGAMYDRKRYEHYLRESRAWESNQAACDKADTIAAAKREAGEGGARRNRGGTDYNILTLDYANTPAGEALKHKGIVAAVKRSKEGELLFLSGPSGSK